MLNAVQQRNLIVIIKDSAPVLSETVYNAIMMLIRQDVIATLKEIEAEENQTSKAETSKQRQKRLNCYIGNGVNNWRCDADCAFWDGERCEREGSVINE